MSAKHPRLAFDRCKLLSNLVKGKNVLDIGCVEHSLENRKRGQWLHEHLRTSAASILGLDYEAAEVEKMRAAGYNVVAADATNFDLERQFDMVVAGELIEHINNAGLFLTCVHKHLKPGGTLVMTTPNANCLIYFVENLLLGREIDNPDHVCIYTPVTMGKLLERHGFALEHTTFLAENTIYCHKHPAAKMMVAIKLFLQLVIGLLRPSICHHMVVIARKSS